MPMTAKERQKKYREKLKLDPQKNEERKKKNRERMKDATKPTSDVSEAEKEKRRLKWQKANEKRRATNPARVQNESVRNESIQNGGGQGEGVQNEAVQNEGVQNEGVPKRKKEDNKTDKRKRLHLLKEIRNLHEVVENLTRLNNRLRKQLYRYRQRSKKENIEIIPKLIDFAASPYTPLSKTEAFLKENIPTIAQEEKERVKKKILELNVLNRSLEKVYENAKDNKTKQILETIASNEIVHKYKMQTKVTKSLGLKGNVRNNQSKTTKVYNSKESKRIRDFFNRDDNSTCTAGKREVVTCKKVKKQKRFLLASMKKLYLKYVSEGSKVSLSTFRRNKPFYVVRPKLSDRDTCACIRHSNLLFKALKLKKLGLINTCDLEELLATVTCSTKSYNCMYSKCAICEDKKPQFDSHVRPDTQCAWLEWMRKEHQYQKHNDDGTTQVIKTKKYVKDVINGTAEHLFNLFAGELLKFKKHFYNIDHQYCMYREVIDNVKEDEVCILIDFSENYQCKLSTEIQSLHFGASRVQITLHTGMIYSKSGKPRSFASVSPCNDHDPGAIWAHLEPVIEYVKTENPQIQTAHFFSDGPTTQYKQKKNFFQMIELLKQNNITFGTWSYFEAAHGKGAADGVGGTLKRVMDQQVAYGKDIIHAPDAFNVMTQNTDIKLFYVPESVIRAKQKSIPGDLIAIPGTMNIHQIIVSDTELRYRDISCFCGKLRGNCGCYNPRKHKLHNKPQENFTESSNQLGCAASENITTKTRISVQQISSRTLKPETKSLLQPSSSKNKNTKTKPTTSKQPEKTIVKVPKPLRKKDFNAKKIQQKCSKRRKISTESITSTDSSIISYAESDESPYTISDDEREDDGYTIIKPGKFALISFKGGKSGTIVFKYVCLIERVYDNGADVFGLVNTDNTCTLFKLGEEGTSFVKNDQILEILEKPKLTDKDGTLFYKFNKSIDLCEMF